MTAFWQDFKLSLRWMVRKPGFTLMITGMLALGIAGNTVIFNIYSGLFMRPLPLPAPERLVDLDEKAPQWNLEYVGISDPDFHAWRSDNQTFELISVWDDSQFNLATEGEAERVRGLETTHDLAELLGYRPVLGRNFSEEEDKPGGEKVVLLSHAMWQRLFGGREDVLGQTLRLDETPHEIIGVLPKEAVFPDAVDLWVPLQSDPNDQTGWYLDGIGRLKPGVTLEQARQDLTRVHKGRIEQRPVNEITSPRLTPLRERYLGDDVRAATTLLLGAVGLVLLIACANVAGLMLARGASRAREMGIRLSLGASRTRIVRQLLTESLVYSLLGGVLGGLAGWAGLRAVVSLMAERMPEWVAFSFDWRFLLFFVAVLLSTAVLFGLMPAFQSTRLNVQQVIRDSALRGGVSAGGRRTLNGLVVAELALAFVLLIGAGLLFRTFTSLQEVDPGFQVSNVLTYGVSLSPQRHSEEEQIRAFFQELIDRSEALPGVVSAGAVSATPLGGHWGNFFEAEGAPERGEDEDNPVVLFRTATPEYFEAMGIRLHSGRWYDATEGQGENKVVVINESMARLHWPNEDAVGKRIRGGGVEGWMTVVGVAQDTKHYGLDEDMRPGVFVPFRQYSIRGMTMVLRTSVDPNTLVEPSRQLVRELDASLPIFGVSSMAERLDRSLWSRRAYSWIFGLFAGVALILALGGIYGVISYAVSQQTHEIGIRMALGARRGHVVRQVLSNGLKLLTIGLILGLAGAAALGQLMSGLLFNVSALDWLTYAIVTLLLASAATAASLAPARRAATIDPLVALRQD